LVAAEVAAAATDLAAAEKAAAVAGKEVEKAPGLAEARAAAAVVGVETGLESKEAEATEAVRVVWTADWRRNDNELHHCHRRTCP